MELLEAQFRLDNDMIQYKHKLSILS